MTDKQINAAIAEACGWTVIRDNVVGKAPGETGYRVMFLPNYCTDLNAMHEAEKTLTIQQKENEYSDNLTQVVIYLKRGLTIGLVEYLGIHATARQRAEAFLRTLGKWEERK